MEDLQDAIEDAQYMNAMNDTSPKPTQQWVMPPPETMEEYMASKAKRPEELTLAYICSTPLGFYLVSESDKTINSLLIVI
jgi:hypothetical protein